MDVNGARCWILHGASDWTPVESPARVGATRGGGLSLQSQRPAPALVEPAADDAGLLALLAAAPEAMDPAGGLASTSAEGDEHVVRVALEGFPTREILRAPASPRGITGLAFGPDGVVTVAVGGEVRLRDTHTWGDHGEDWRRLPTGAVGTLDAHDVAPAAPTGAWILDRANRRLLRWSGLVPRRRPTLRPSPGTFRPSPEDPPTLEVRVHADGFDGDAPVALASSPSGRAAVLAHRDGEARVHLYAADGAAEGVLTLAGLVRPASIGWLGEARIAVLALDGGSLLGEALVYPATPGRLLPVGDLYPLPGAEARPLLHGPDGIARYHAADGVFRVRAVSLPLRPGEGRALGRVLDGGDAEMCWHRVFVDADVPEGCGVRVELATTPDEDDVPREGEWFPHDLGKVPVDGPRGTPRFAWSSAPSEVPGAAGTLDVPSHPGRAGLYSALVQRAGRRTRRLVGRFLHVRVTLFGDGRRSPELGAVRVWGPRFSYVREYLPELYHEDPLVDGDASIAGATPADFFERFVALFEGVLTPLEDQVADAWRMTHPATIPAESLDWLASWVGRALDPGLGEAARRRMVLAFPALSRWRGTKRGLELALEVATEGGYTRGEVLVVEAWRLRRTWATILGVDLADEADPLLQGLVVSGNSIVGDSLVLGSEHHREFLAVFGEAAQLNAADRAAVERFFGAAANRATVLVREDLGPAFAARVARVVDDEAPAHVLVEVRPASGAFVAGLTALVGVDTRFVDAPALETVRLGRSRLGRGDRLSRPGGLHPDFEGDVG